MAWPAIAGLVLGGAGVVNSAIQGGKQNDLNEEALRLERLREVDRQMMRDMFMQRARNAPTPEQHRYDAAQLAQQGFGQSENPFARPQMPLGERPQGWTQEIDPRSVAEKLRAWNAPGATTEDKLKALNEVVGAIGAPKRAEEQFSGDAERKVDPESWYDQYNRMNTAPKTIQQRLIRNAGY